MMIYLVMLMMTGCGGPSKQYSQAECQQNYDVSKNSALDAYEACSKANCNGQLIMVQGQDSCTESCFKDLQDARSTIDSTLADCMTNAVVQ